MPSAAIASSPVASPGKLGLPRLHRVLARERLFDLVDAGLPSGAVWIYGPPGAGKTMLAASWLQARRRAAVWYRFDSDDNDAASWFAALEQAFDGLCVAPVPRPRFAAEHLARPAAFAREWFGGCGAGLRRPLVLVLDNLEQAAIDELPALLDSAVGALPERVSLLITSRTAPPEALATHIVAGRLAVLDPEVLRFTACEAGDYARQWNLDADAMVCTAARIDGWAAGLRLLSAANGSVAPAGPVGPAALDRYFAGLLEHRAGEQLRQVLATIALLPWIPAERIDAICGVRDAARLLDMLCNDQLFVDRTDSGAYRLHPLFHDFLRRRCTAMLAPPERRALLRAAADEFAVLGDVDAQIELLLGAEDAAAVVERLVAVRDDKLAAGHVAQWCGWVERLPDAVLGAEPDLLYGLARAGFLREDRGALDHYRRACAGFAARGDLLGQQLCAAGVLEWSYNSDSFIDHERWSALLRGAQPVPGDELAALRLLNGRLLACFFDGDFAAEGDALAAETLAWLVPGRYENEKLSAAISLLGCYERHKRWDAAVLLADRMEALLESPRLGPRLKVLVRQQIASDLYRQCGRYDDARRLALRSRDEARAQGFHVLEYEAIAVLLLVALYEGDGATADALLGEKAALHRSHDVYHQRLAAQLWCWQDLQAGRLASAHGHAEALRAAIDRSDMPARFRATWLLLAVYADYAGGRVDAALAELDALVAQAEPGSRATLEVNAACLRAAHELAVGQPDAAAARLAQAWPRAAAMHYYQLLAALRAPLADLAALALARDIEPAFTRELIKRRRLCPPSPAVQRWPWPLAIRTLGDFALEADGVPLVFEGKSPRKPLALLKALIALGPPPVPEHMLADALWPDEDADAARDALNVALHRLRKRIPHGAQAIRLHDGRIGLDPERVWIDCRAFEHLLAEAEHAGAPAQISRLGEAIALYRGHFLMGEFDERWAVSARERLRARHSRAVARQGQLLCEAGRDEAAMDCYRRGIETDDLDESLYQGVMRCALRLRRPSEGLIAYQRLKRVLSLLLGVPPSPESQALMRQLAAASSIG